MTFGFVVFFKYHFKAFLFFLTLSGFSQCVEDKLSETVVNLDLTWWFASEEQLSGEHRASTADIRNSEQ